MIIGDINAAARSSAAALYCIFLFLLAKKGVCVRFVRCVLSLFVAFRFGIG